VTALIEDVAACLYPNPIACPTPSKPLLFAPAPVLESARRNLPPSLLVVLLAKI
jgi:hypothetical protein